jgi:hypothetical protein
MVRELSPKLMLGINGSYNVGMSSRRGRENGDFLFYNITNSDTSLRLPNYLKTGADLLFKYRGFSLIAEFIMTKAFISDDITTRNDRYGNPEDLTTNFRGYSAEEYVRTQLMMGSGINLQAGYLFKNLFSIDGRFTSLNPDEYSFMNNTSFYNRNKYYTIGISKYFSKNYSYKIQASYTLVDEATIRDSRDLPDYVYNGSENILRLMVQIAF